MFTDAYHRYGPAVTSHDAVKALAIALMVVDHVGDYIFPDALGMRLIGRFAMPMFLFLVGYMQKTAVPPGLWLWGLLIVAVDALTHNPIFATNILFSVIAARFTLKLCDRYCLLDKSLFVLFIHMVIWFPLAMVLFDYGTLAILFALSGALVARRGATREVTIFLFATAGFYAAVQTWGFKFTPVQAALLAAGLAPLLYAMLHYAPRTFSGMPQALAVPVKILGRYSLPFYALHLIMLKLLELYLYPETYGAFEWIVFKAA